MIALRRKIERGMRHPLLGPFLVVLFALLLVFVALHGTHDQAHAAGPGVICLTVAAIFFLAVTVLRPLAASVRLVVVRRRGPPRPLEPATVAQPVTSNAPVPLRL